jgi:hypothetical protein
MCRFIRSQLDGTLLILECVRKILQVSGMFKAMGKRESEFVEKTRGLKSSGVSSCLWEVLHFRRLISHDLFFSFSNSSPFDQRQSIPNSFLVSSTLPIFFRPPTHYLQTQLISRVGPLGGSSDCISLGPSPWRIDLSFRRQVLPHTQNHCYQYLYSYFIIYDIYFYYAMQRDR